MGRGGEAAVTAATAPLEGKAIGKQGSGGKRAAKHPAWYALAEEFGRHHSNSLNVAAHLVTTPLGIGAAMALLTKACADSGFFQTPNAVPFVLVLMYVRPRTARRRGASGGGARARRAPIRGCQG